MSQRTIIRIDGERNSEPSKHEVLSRVHSVSLNFRNIAVATSQYPFSVKHRVGEGVKKFTPGDRGLATFELANLYGQQANWENGQGAPTDGVLREYISIPAASVVKIPKDSPQSFSEWSALVCTGVTVWNALYGNMPLRPGQNVLCLGTRGVSITGVILAKAAGATTIIHLVQRREAPDERRLRYHRRNLKSVGMGGNVLVIGFLSQAKEMPDVASLALAKGAVVRGITVGSTQLLEELTRFVAQKGLRLPVEKEFRFTQEEAVKAYEYMASGSHIGKVCIKIVDCMNVACRSGSFL
ncbi:zinc-dependent alcohol dehydrogenase family protein [Aspergillus homomorphus CBS 101889]|uniref:Enoyl reductase (ER) domain-containing protein n=1 Tax=Aspergillus homomorphus (strain CBS 101889) TaxID=1450537 RepID=A0A395HJM5_ASPHC|nr:hypothetical protein BO97DRAFT_473692 [Aspergillus homomorphus CBS 101889]RAL07385.1 hypothetical protein BO97DRAFT_473692 [Aspergillus homomorphus CBS 101889]